MRVTLNATLRMKRFTFALVPWMALTATAHGQVRMADVVFTHFDDVPTRAFRVGDECFVPIDAVKRWGWDATLVDGLTVNVKAEGKELQLPMRVFSGRQTLPLRVAVGRLGGLADWAVGTDSLRVTSELNTVSLSGTSFSVNAPLDFRPKASLLANPGRIVMDLTGVRIGPGTKQSVPSGVRVTQFRPNVVRVVIPTDLTPNLGQIPATGLQSLSVDFGAIAVAPQKAAPVTVTPKVATQPEVTPTDPPPTEPVTPPTAVDAPPLLVQFENDERVSIRLPLGETLTSEAIISSPTPETLAIRLPGVNLVLPPEFKLSTESVTSTQAVVDEQGTTLTLTLPRPMGAEAVTQGGTVLITLVKPPMATGSGLRGKVIVVDPGHGGFDPGAQTAGVREKDLNLKIGRLIAAALEAEGATVIMTRSTDVFIPLEKRAEIANRAKADFFISNHINSTGKAATQSGTITFHHMNREICRVFAECIQTELAKVNKLPNLGVWSDRRLYQSGLSVLRNTKMTGVLLELGFVNSSRDRARMVTDDFQRSVAAAVVRGIKVFLGNAKEEK